MFDDEDFGTLQDADVITGYDPEEVTAYRCPECQTLYEDIERARSCMEECADLARSPTDVIFGTEKGYIAWKEGGKL